MIIQWGTPEQQQRWLPGILTADEHWCQGFSEPEAGSDLANLRTMAIRDGDDYVVNGQKIWISTAHLAKWGLFLLRTDPTAIERGAKHEGITAFIIDMETPGIECRPIRDITGDTMLNEVFFTDAIIPVDCRLGGEGEGWQVAMSTLGHERVGTAGLSITMAADLRSMVAAALAVNPDALRDPELRDRVGRAFTDIELTRLLNYRALTKIIKGQPNWPEVPLAKLQWSKISQTLAELAVDLLGPGGRPRQGRTRRRRRRHLDPQLLLAALHVDRRRRDGDPEEHHRQEGHQAPSEVDDRHARWCGRAVPGVVDRPRLDRVRRVPRGRLHPGRPVRRHVRVEAGVPRVHLDADAQPPRLRDGDHASPTGTVSRTRSWPRR